MARPVPPGRLQNGEGEVSDRPFEPAPDLAAWIIETFITEGAALCNEDHAHLRDATIGALWSAVPQFRHGQRIVGQANLGRASVAAPKWYQARFAQQTIDWFGSIPNFVLTFDVDYALNATDREFLALIEHQLAHCAQAYDENGPRFSPSTGLPVYTLKSHDCEEFFGVVRRYGPVTDDIATLVSIAGGKPEVTDDDIERVSRNGA